MNQEEGRTPVIYSRPLIKLYHIMKKRCLKLGMPMMAFLMAIAFAFATEKSSDTDRGAPMTAYIYNDLERCVDVEIYDCNPFEGLPCTLSGKQVFEQQINQTTCDVQLFRN